MVAPGVAVVVVHGSAEEWKVKRAWKRYYKRARENSQGAYEYGLLVSLGGGATRWEVWDRGEVPRPKAKRDERTRPATSA